MSTSNRKLEEEYLFDEKERWVVNRINRLQTVDREKKPESVIIRDDTLRSGANTPGVYTTNEKKMKIAEKLEEAGVKEVEAAYAGIEEHHQFLRMLKRAGLKLRLGAHLLLLMDDWKDRMDRSIEAGADIINMVAGLPPAGRRLSEDEVLETAQEAINYSKKQGMFTSIGGEFERLDSTQRRVKAWVEAGADRICVYDGRGWLLPNALSFLIRYVKDIVGERVEVSTHCHNDFGLATINTLEGYRAGAIAADVTVNGTGHRCGNAPLEQVVTALEVLYHIRTGIDLSKTYQLCKLVEETYEVKIPANQPHVGEVMYAYGGAHIPPALRGEWYMWENVKAETLGCSRSIMWGSTVQSGRSGPIGAKVEQMGLTCTDKQLDAIFDKLQGVVQHKKFATDAEMEQIIRECIG